VAAAGRSIAARRPRTGAPRILLLAAVLCARGATAVEPTPAASITPIARIQAALEETAHSQSAEQLAAALQQLTAMGGPDYRDLIPQLVIFAMQPRDARTALLPGVVRGRLGITDAQFVDGLLPYLETPDRQQRAQMYNWLGGIDTADSQGREFGLYRTVIAARRDDPPLGLVRYMYDTDASVAVTTLAEVYATPSERQALRAALQPVEQAWARHRAGRPEPTPTAARTALTTLARNPAWWVRVYAATASAQMPELQTPELLKVLRADRHPLVQQLTKDLNPEPHRR